MKKNRDQTSESLLLSAILSFSGGFQDAYTYNIRGGVFANAQTGNIVLMGQHILCGEFMTALRYILPVAAFVLGIIIAEQISHRFKDSSKIHWRQIVLIFEIVLLVIVGFMPKSCDTVANIVVSLSCAMQVQAFRKVHGYGYASTMCIGNMRSGAESFSQFLRSREKQSLLKAFHYFGIILIFALGAGIGALLSGALGINAIWVSAAILLVCCLMMIKKEF